jgi:hypothetical protein
MSEQAKIHSAQVFVDTHGLLHQGSQITDPHKRPFMFQVARWEVKVMDSPKRLAEEHLELTRRYFLGLADAQGWRPGPHDCARGLWQQIREVAPADCPVQQLAPNGFFGFGG